MQAALVHVALVHAALMHAALMHAALLTTGSRRAPYGALAHPTPEHFLPLIFTAGAGRLNDDAARTRRLHHSYSYGSIGMSSWEFAREA